MSAGRRNLLRVAAVLAVVASSCGDDDDDDDDAAAPSAAVASTAPPEDPVADAEARVAAAQDAVADATASLEAAVDQTCGDAETYLDALDRYGKLFTDGAATVGDVQTLGADLVAPRDTVTAAAAAVVEARTALAAAEQELIDAEAALAVAIATASSVPPPASTEPAPTTSTLVPAASVDRVRQAEEELATASAGITEATPLADATAEYNSAAFALQIAWSRVLVEGGCLSDEEQAQALEQVTAYTVDAQTRLQAAGYDPGDIDGIYGPKTVAAVKQLQADSGLRETGYLDAATTAALDAKLAELGAQEAAAAMTETAAVQAVLTAAGFWSGPIDGEWTDELTQALMAFQTALGVPPTGAVDVATLAAFEQALAERDAIVQGAATSTTPPATTPPRTTVAPPPPQPEPEPTTAAATSTSAAGP